MPDQRPLDAELLHQANSLRALAGALVKDPHRAEDATQATLVAALEHRTLRAGPLGGWLYRTLVNVARQMHRAERRRDARHASLPSPPTTPAPIDYLGHLETIAAVTRAVRELAEPFRTAICMRYFEGLPPRAIARATGTNVATVKSRLQRALGLLRERLDQGAGPDRRDWRASLAITFGLPLPFAAAGLTPLVGAWLMGTATKITVAAVALGAGSLWYFTLGNEPPPATSTATERQPGDTGAAAEASPQADTALQREATTPTAAATLDWLDHPYQLELEVLALDDLGMPFAGRQVRLAPRHCRINDAGQQTDAKGKLLLTFAARTTEAEVVLRDGAHLRTVTLRHGQRTVVTLGETRGRDNNVRMRWEGTLKAETGGSFVLQGLPLLGNIFTQAIGLPSLAPGMHPFAVFHECGTPQLAPTPPETPTSTSESISFGYDVSVEEAETKARRKLTGTVFGTDGKPAAQLPILALGKDDTLVAHGTTGDDGSFTFDDLTPGSFTLRAGGTAAGLATTRVEVADGVTTAQLHLSLGTTLEGRVHDTAGKPVAGAIATFRSDDGRWWDRTLCADDGTFRFANLPTARGRIEVRAPQDGPPLAVATTTAMAVGTAIELTLPAATGTLQFEAAPPESAAKPRAEARLWQLDTGLGIAMTPPDKGGVWRVERLPAGWYQLELFVAGCGWVDSGRHWLDGQGTTDLGRIPLPPPAVVTLTLQLPPVDPTVSPQGPVAELYELRRDLDVHHDAGDLLESNTLLLPAGDYVIALRLPGGPTFHRLRVAAGTPQTVVVGK